MPPHAKERPRRGPEAGGAVFIRPPWGADIGIPARARRRLSQISIVGHYAYENRPATLLPWASNSCTSRHTRAMAPSSTASRANGRRERSPPRPCASLTPAPTWPSPAAPGAARLHPAEAAKLAHDWADSSQDAKGRKLRADGLALAAGVVSLPAEQRQDWPRFREATVAWLRQQYGERLRSVVEHTDEAHPHLHFYAVPLPGERFSASPRTAGRSRKGPPRGPKGRTERRIQAGYGGVAGWLSKGRSGPFWAYAAWPWQAAADAGEPGRPSRSKPGHWLSRCPQSWPSRPRTWPSA